MLDYIYFAIGDPVIKWRVIGIPLASLTPPHWYAYPKPAPGLQKSNVMICFMFNDMRCDVIVDFVDID